MFSSGSQLCMLLFEMAAGQCIKEAHIGVYYTLFSKDVCVSGG